MSYLLLAIVTIVSGQILCRLPEGQDLDPLGLKHTVGYDASRPTRRKLAHGYGRGRISSSAGITQC
jgi:hypothetical protein